MDSILSGLYLVADRFVALSGAELLQSSVLIGVVWIVDLLIRRRARAVVRYGLWLLVFVKLLVPPHFSLPVSVAYWAGQPVATAVDQVTNRVASLGDEGTGKATARRESARQEAFRASFPQPAAESASEESSLWSEPSVWLFGLWLIGVVMLGVRMVLRLAATRRLVASSQDPDRRLIRVAENCAREAGLRHPVPVRWVDEAIRPCVCGLFRPVILLPASLLDQLDERRIRLVLRHELAHVSRKDLWVSTAQSVLQILYFFHPLVWFAGRHLNQLREKAVDERVVASLRRNRFDYHMALLEVYRLTAALTPGPANGLGAIQNKSLLGDRIRHLTDRPLPRRGTMGRWNIAFLSVGGLVLLPMAGRHFGGAAWSGDLAPTHGLEACWLFDDPSGNMVYDQTGRHDVRLTNAEFLPGEGRSGGALGFKRGDFLNLGPRLASGRAFTVSFWMKVDSLRLEQPISKMPQNRKLNGWAVRIFDTGEVAFRYRSHGDTCQLSAPDAYQPGKWVAIACTFDGCKAAIYVNGHERIAEFGVDADLRNVTTMLRLGAPGDYKYGSRFSGMLDDVRIYDKALNSHDIYAIYEDAR